MGRPLLVASVVNILDPEEPGQDLATFVLVSPAWIVLDACYAEIRVSRVRRARRGDQRWPERLAGRRTSYLITLATAITLRGGGVDVVLIEGDGDVVTVLLASAILHPIYALRPTPPCCRSRSPFRARRGRRCSTSPG
ncbi:hypothetical protein ACQPZQ_36275 [Pseudonocardia sp. CA-142604]|uniref:hypothetical protein n=1 Tax=Pseudonocardia sp. CA-142604 TaxID=3240024 RepID=UPI003D8D60EF